MFAVFCCRYYTLRDIIFFLENAEVGMAQYRVNVNAAPGVTAVVWSDAKNLKSYLTGGFVHKETYLHDKDHTACYFPHTTHPPYHYGTILTHFTSPGEITTCDQIDQAKRNQDSAAALSSKEVSGAPSSPTSARLAQQRAASTSQPLGSSSTVPEHLKVARQEVLQSFLHLLPASSAATSSDSSTESCNSALASFLSKGYHKQGGQKDEPPSLSADQMSFMTVML